MWNYTLLPKILNMSLTGGVVIIAVLLTRLLLRRAPKVFSYALWAVVLFRLLCPVALSLDVSLLRMVNAPATQTGTIEYIPPNIVHTEYPRVELPLPGVSERINETLPQGEEQLAADPLEAPVSLATFFWIIGMAGLVIYSAVSLLLLRKRLVGAVRLRDSIYIADHIDTPFVIGLIRPRIYLPSSLSGREREYIILHERCHIRRLDHAAKLLFFAALCIHWFNPLVWLAFYLMGKDMEMSCDEAVLRKVDEDIRADYSASLLSLATGRRIIAGAPLAFGEGDPKSRIKNVLSFKKPTVWIIIAAALLCTAVAVLCAVNPRSSKPSDAEPLSAGEVYVTDKCLYMNPLSSFYPMDGDNGYNYRVGEDSFAFYTRSNGLKRLVSPVSWGWQDLPWTQEEWNALFSKNEEYDFVNLKEYDELLYQPLEESHCLINADGQLWLVEINGLNGGGRIIWSIYTLKKGTQEQHAELNADMSGFAPEDIHDLVSAELQMAYGSFKLTDAESLAWLESELGSATEVIGGIDSEFSAPLYLTRSDGKVGVIYPADNGWAVFRADATCYGWTGNLGAKLWELFGVESEHMETEYNEAGQKLRETSYYVNQIRYVIEYEYDESGRPLKTTVNNTNGTVNTTESEYENGLLLRTVYRSDGEITGSTEYEYDADGDVIKMSGVKPDGTVSSTLEYVYDYFNGKKLQSEIIQHTYPYDDPYTQRFEYNELGQQVKIKSFAADGSQTNEQTFEYDDAGNITVRTLYNMDGEIVRKVVYEYEYDENSKQTYVNQYNGNGELVKRSPANQEVH